MSGVLIGFAIVGFVIFVGYIAARYQIAGPHGVQVLTKTAFFITNPALLFTVLAQADLDVVFSVYAPIALITAALTAAVYVLASRLWFPRPVAATAIGAMSSSYVNANNIGIPIALYALGNATPVAPVLLVQLLILAPLYLLVMDLSSGRKANAKTLLTQPLRNPMIIASFLGMLVAATGFRLPAGALEPMVMLGGAAVPLVLMAFGMSLHGSRPLQAREGRTEALVATALKSTAMPLITYLVGHFVFRLDSPHLFAAVIMAALPTGQNVFMIASRYNLGVGVSRETVLLSSILAVPALFVAAWLLA
ncbi:AEC family transporter [Arthrobacter sp.]|uniref:AEC family transporter n=1 Tax=Arthrobacter sp. TaxID=1667 RepID=UPI0033931DB7